MKATGIVRRIDDLGRVVIPKEIRRTLRIREGDPLEIYTEKDGEVIFKKYSPMGDLSEFSGQLCEAIHKNTGHLTAVADRETIIALSGVPRKELLDKPVSKELEQLMSMRRTYQYTGTDGGLLAVDGMEKYKVCVGVPIMAEGDYMGCVILLMEAGKPFPSSELEQKLVQTVATFLGSQMEN